VNLLFKFLVQFLYSESKECYNLGLSRRIR